MAANAQNLLVNPSFETWEAGAPTGWTIVAPTAATSEANFTTINDGATSLKVIGGTATYSINQTIPVTIGKTYTLSMSYYIEAGDGTDARLWCNLKNGTVYLTEAELTTAGILEKLKGPGGSAATFYFPDVKGSWQTYTTDFVVPAGVTDFNFEFRTYKSPAIVYWDNMFFGEKDFTPPTINTSVGLLNNLSYDKGNGPSSEQSFSVSGESLTSDIVITPSSTNLQISKTSGAGFSSNPITLTQSAGSVAATTIYVRLKAGLNFADYTENLAITTTNGTTKNVACAGTVVGPTITASTTSLSIFSYNRGAGPSSSKSFSVSGVLLEDYIVVTPAANYEISTNNSNFISTPITLTPIAETVPGTTIYVRLKAGLTPGAYSESVTLTSTNAVTKTIACSGNVLGPNVVSSASSLTGFNYAADSARQINNHLR